ncbi:uncharacterized protein [Montipora capricornis]|uniref:uncharacterized protein n=1 Tax=Montipora capricornis TaxID=246305 RepID=UPI0035F1B981
MSTYGKLEEFDRDSDTWELYIERLNSYFEANKIGGEGDGLKLRRTILLSSVGNKTYKLMCDFLAPEKPGDKPYPELCTMGKNHFNPKPSESVQRHKFNNRFRANGESISDFVAALRHLAEYCNFGGSLENMLRDRLVSGVNNEKIQTRLLSEGELTFKKAFEIALSLETTAQHMADLQSTPSTSAMASASVKKEGACSRELSKKKARKSSEKSSNPTSSQQGKQRVHVLDTEEPDEEQDIYPLFAVSPSSHKNPYMVTVELNGLEVKMEVDTGASLSVISEDVYTQLKNIEGSSFNLQDNKLTLKSYTGEIIPVLGTLSVEVKYKNTCLQSPRPKFVAACKIAMVRNFPSQCTIS